MFDVPNILLKKRWINKRERESDTCYCDLNQCVSQTREREREREREAQKESDKQHKKGGGKPTRQYDIHRLRVSEYSTHTQKSYS